VPIGHAVEPVEELVGHVGERLDQRHARVGDVVVRPFRTALLDEPFGIVDQILNRRSSRFGSEGHHSASSGMV